jgi:hypothetical protein
MSLRRMFSVNLLFALSFGLTCTLRPATLSPIPTQ